MSEGGWNARVRALIADADGRLLIRAGEDGPRLPAVEVEGSDDELPAIREALLRLVGVDTIVVRSVERAVDEERKTVDLALELEPLGSSTLAWGAGWMPAAELARSAPEGERSLVERLLADDAPPERPDWARRGWFTEASAWIRETLVALGRPSVGPIEQISNWCISSILRAETAEGRVYFKATARSPLFVNEGIVTQGLAALFPGAIPSPIAIDPARRWMLLDDFGPVVGWGADLETRVDVISTYGRMQVESASRQDELLALGLFDRRPAWLAAEIESLPRSSAALGLEERELEALVELVPRLLVACERLAAGSISSSLVHGDLHLANVARHDGRSVFFDWTDACVAHPFLDLLVVVFEDDDDARRTLRDAYLGTWAELASEAELRELWRLAEPLACLNQAVSYRSILANVERGTATELASMHSYWLRKALAAADNLADVEV